MSGAAHHARASFPRGLFQPPGSFRFSSDALLLAAFAVRYCLAERRSPECLAPHVPALLDLGCGCGVVGLACLLAVPALAAVGVDIQPELVAAARENAARLGLEARFTAVTADIAAPAPVVSAARLTGGGYAVVAANMPYRQAGSGRLPASPARRKALFAEESTMPAFLNAAKAALAEDGSLALVYPWDGRDVMLSALSAHGFTPREILPVRTGNEDGSRCLIRSVHAGTPNTPPEKSRAHSPAGPEPAYLAPLVLRAEKGGPYTTEALAFCPWAGSLPWQENRPEDISQSE